MAELDLRASVWRLFLDKRWKSPRRACVEEANATTPEQHSASWVTSRFAGTQTKHTYQQLRAGTPVEALGGNSNAMAFRGAALLAYYDDEEEVAHAARASMFTHREAPALDGGEFFARVAFRVARGLAPRDAVEAVAAQSSSFV